MADIVYSIPDNAFNYIVPNAMVWIANKDGFPVMISAEEYNKQVKQKKLLLLCG